MNQILLVKNEDVEKQRNNFISKKRFIFRIQFFVLMLFLACLIIFYIYHSKISSINSDNYAARLSDNYQVYRLYASNSNGTNSSNQNTATANIIGNIEIPKIGISYPILSTLNDELLKASPCRFYGEISDNSNLCIAGHNYDNNSFFSKIRLLNNNDKIIISDNNNKKYTFEVFNNYEVSPSDLSPIYNVTSRYKKELTLVTCNNQNNKRIIIKGRLI